MSAHSTMETFRLSFRVPDVDADRCIHSQIEQGSCRKCVEDCPTGAWVIDDELLGIDTDLCDGCGLCVASCPEQAISAELPIVLRGWKGRPLAMACCEKNKTGMPQDAIIPCVNAIGINRLLALYAEGCNHLVITHGDCASCTRSGSLDLLKQVKGVNRVLRSRDLPPLLLKDSEPAKFMRIWLSTTAELSAKVVDRRRFFRQAVAELVERGLETIDPEESGSEAMVPPVSRLSGNDREKAVFPWVPTIDDTKCNGCNACVNDTCPHAALQKSDENDPAFGYQILPENCTGCGICSDLCNENAISLRRWSRCDQRFVELSKGRCEICGAPTFRPAGSAHDHFLCHICESTNHHKNLYQVLE